MYVPIKSHYSFLFISFSVLVFVEEEKIDAHRAAAAVMVGYVGVVSLFCKKNCNKSVILNVSIK